MMKKFVCCAIGSLTLLEQPPGSPDLETPWNCDGSDFLTSYYTSVNSESTAIFQ